MAGDWIKMRTDLLTSPKVVRISSALKTDRFRTVGGLLSVWSLFDAHSEDGTLRGYDLDALDALAAWSGFASALVDVGWLTVDGESLALPRFESHNGQSAKRRAQDKDRKDSVRKMSALEADKKRTREEKRREEEERIAIEQQAARKGKSRFPEFWSAFPVKKGKAEAEKKWKSRNLDEIADVIIADVKRRTAEDRQWLDGYAPHGSTYVNGRGWEDDIESSRHGAMNQTPDYMVGAI